MATGFLAISGEVSGSRTSTTAPKPLSIPVISASSAVDDERVVSLSSGDNSITIPTGATAVVLIPPAANVQTLALGASGIVPIHATNPTLLSLRSGTTSLVVNAGGSVSGFVVRCI